MAEQKKKSQAEKAAAVKNKKNIERKKAADKKETKQTGERTKIPARLISSLIFISLFVLFFVMFINPDGVMIKALDKGVHGLIGGIGFFVSIPVFLYLFIIHALSGKRPVKMRTVSLLLFVLCCGCIHHLVICIDNMAVAKLFAGGHRDVNTTAGLLCGSVAQFLRAFCGQIISFILLIVAAVMTLLGGMQITIPSIVRAVQNRPRADWEENVPDKPEPASIVVNHLANKRIEHIEKKRRLAEEEKERKKEPKTRAEEIMKQIDADVEDPVAIAGHAVISDKSAEVEVLTDSFGKVSVQPAPVEKTPKPISKSELEPEPEPELIEIPVVMENKPEKITAKEAAKAAVEVAIEIEEAESEEKQVYCFPPINLLKQPSKDFTDGTAEMQENTRRLNETLASFKIEAHIINVTRGPSVTRYEVELEKGVRLSKLTSAADDIALSLGASGVRIAAVPGKISVVGIEVPNRAVTAVSLREVIDSGEFSGAKSMSSFAVGKDIGGNCIVGNISKLPHMLIAGTTGSGKSVCMNSIIISLLYKASPDDVKLIMVDPKMVELVVYNGIPHLLIPVVTDPKKAAGSLQWAVSEMMRRYKAMSDAGVRDMESYNSIVESHEEGGKKLPRVVVIIDELADLMLVAAKEVEESICRIAQMGRAAGIHLIIATQRPSADVITGLMKANIPSRIAFSVASAMESRIILDTQGAEKLVGRGDMLYAPIGSGKPKRVQGCFVSDPEVEAVASYVKSNFVTDYDQTVMEEIEKKAAQAGTGKTATASDPEPTAEELDGDEMLPAAVDVILETGQASVSMLQRRLKLGYARAARIVDEMEEKGIVGPYQGSKPRTILVTKEQWEVMRSGQSAQMDFDDLNDDTAEDIE